MPQPSPEVLRAAQQARVTPSEDMLKRVRDKVREARDLERLKADQEAALKETNAALQALYYRDLPDVFDEAGVSQLTLAPEGNLPGYGAKAEPYYHANIAAEWDEERRNAAFQWLDDNGHGDLVKTTVTLFFPKGSREGMKKFVDYAQQHGLNCEVKDTVPWNSLTAWLKDMVKNKKIIPPLETLGATIGRIVKLKPIAPE